MLPVTEIVFSHEWCAPIEKRIASSVRHDYECLGPLVSWSFRYVSTLLRKQIIVRTIFIQPKKNSSGVSDWRPKYRPISPNLGLEHLSIWHRGARYSPFSNSRVGITILPLASTIRIVPAACQFQKTLLSVRARILLLFGAIRQRLEPYPIVTGFGTRHWFYKQLIVSFG